MTPPKLITPDSAYRTDEWLEARRLGVTATDIAKIAGLHRYGSAFEVYQDKIGDPLPDDAGEAAELGNILEPVVAELWAKREDRQVLPAGLYANGDRPWMLATPDRLVVHPYVVGFDPIKWLGIEGPLEIKTALGWAHLDWADDGQVPDEHMCQLTWQMGVLGCRRGWIAALAGPRLVSYEVELDQAYLDDLIAIAERFREQVANRTPPTPDGTERTARFLSRKWEPDPDKTVVLNPSEFEPLRKAHEQASVDEVDAKVRKAAAANAIRLLLADAEAAVIDGEVVATWRASERNGFTVKPGTVRTLNVKKAKA